MDFATTLRVIRVMLNWRQAHIAEAFSVTPETVSMWETAQREPHITVKRMLIILAERNGVILNQRGFPEYAQREGFKLTP